MTESKPKMILCSIVGPRKLGEPVRVYKNNLFPVYEFSNLNQVKFAFAALDKLVNSLIAREKKKDQRWNPYKHLRFLSGGAYGGDEIGRLWALKNQYHFTCFPAQWNLYDKAAGFMRNSDLAEADYVIAFWDGDSKGTADTITKSKSNKAKLKVVRYEIDAPYNS